MNSNNRNRRKYFVTVQLEETNLRGICQASRKEPNARKTVSSIVSLPETLGWIHAISFLCICQVNLYDRSCLAKLTSVCITQRTVENSKVALLESQWIFTLLYNSWYFKFKHWHILIEHLLHSSRHYARNWRYNSSTLWSSKRGNIKYDSI